jgi:ketosteroid isomerase-like protein
MCKALVSMLAGGMLVMSSLAFAQEMDSKAACNKGGATWMTAYNNGDAETIANWYDPNSGTFSSLFWTAAGHDALLAGFKKEMSEGIKITSIVCDHANQLGKMIVSDGAWESKGNGPDGKEATFRGHWMAVSEIRDGKPVVLTHVSNMDALPPNPPK